MWPHARACACVCTAYAYAHWRYVLSLTAGWTWGHRTTPPSHLLGWDRTSPPGPEDHYIQLPLTQGKASQGTCVLFKWGESRESRGLAYAIHLGMQLKKVQLSRRSHEKVFTSIGTPQNWCSAHIQHAGFNLAFQTQPKQGLTSHLWGYVWINCFTLWLLSLWFLFQAH